MSAALIALAAKVGAPLVEGIIARKLGDAAGQLAGEVVDLIADGAGTTAEMLPEAIAADPARVSDAILRAEAELPQMIELYSQEAEGRIRLLEGEKAEPLLFRAWRPMGMYGLGLLWIWNVILLHVANALWRIALPPVPYDILLQISALYMSLYMGGHTVKSVVETWKAKA